MKFWVLLGLWWLFTPVLSADETFVTIQAVRGNQLTIVMDAGGARSSAGGSSIGGSELRRSSGRRGGAVTAQPILVTIPSGVKITSAHRERRTFEFRIGAELAGGLEHRVFREKHTPLPARIVTEGNTVTEINVIIPDTDINQSATSSGGEVVIAVIPKRPPSKSKSPSKGSR